MAIEAKEIDSGIENSRETAFATGHPIASL